jgi:hypothetical protein
VNSFFFAISSAPVGWRLSEFVAINFQAIYRINLVEFYFQWPMY